MSTPDNKMQKSTTVQEPVIPHHITDNELLLCYLPRRKNVFVTQPKKKTNEQLIGQHHNELIKYIDKMENKVQKIIQSHDSEFLLAYKNHLNRVREEMQELKNKNAKQANSASSQTQRIETLQKQLILFRQQSLKLFDKMTDKQKQIELLNMKVYELQTEQKFNKRTITELMKRNKYLQGLAKEFDFNKTQQKIQFPQSTSGKKKSVSFLDVNSLIKYSSQQKRAKNLGKTDYSFFYQNNKTYNNQSEKQSGPTTTAFGSKRNSFTIHNYQNVKSGNEYLTKNLPLKFRQV